MADEGMSLREFLIDRIREIRALKMVTQSKSAMNQLEELEAINMKIYYRVFGGKV